MKLYYDKKSNDPTYYIQAGFRNGKKTSTRNVAKIGKHSALLAIDPDPLAYAKRQVLKANEAQKNNKVSMNLEIDFDAMSPVADSFSSKSISKFMLTLLFF